jgi:hypothetical protein
MKIHPVAEMFPMMPEEELAVDIKANSLINPIVLDSEGTLIGGRNRLEACRRAKVEPQFEQLNGVDPIAFILSSNDRRRHMSKGARAMVAVKVRRVFNTQSTRQVEKEIKVSFAYISHAATVLEFPPELADAVVACNKPLNEAYAEAQRRKEVLQSDDCKKARLRREAPDLADQVLEDCLELRLRLSSIVTPTTAQDALANSKFRQNFAEFFRQYPERSIWGWGGGVAKPGPPLRRPAK